jgi:hypothetical protein
MMKNIKRYTTLADLLHILSTKKLTLLSPITWTDRNDAYLIDEYRQKKELKSVLALCLTKTSNTYHHWKIFGDGMSGICIDFHSDIFSKWANSIPNARLEEIKYIKVEDRPKVELSKLPFRKRIAFRHEREIRLILDERYIELKFKAFDFDYSMIKSIITSPWLPSDMFKSVQEAIICVSKNALSKKQIKNSTMLANEIFMKGNIKS